MSIFDKNLNMNRMPNLANRPGADPYSNSDTYGSLSYANRFANVPTQDALSAWYAQAQKNQLQAAWDAFHPQGQAPAAPQGGGAPGGGGGAYPWQGGGGGGAPAPAGPPMDQFSAAVAHVNSQYDDQLKNLDRLTGSAKAGTTQVGNETNQRLAALAKDARGQNKKSNQNIKSQFSGTVKQQAADFATLLADLQRQGALTQGLGSEESARVNAIKGAGARQGAQSQRYTQLLNQSLNERGGLARQTTKNSLEDLTKALQSAQFVAQQRKADQLYEIEQARAEAAAAAAAAASRGGGGGGGGGYGGSGKELTVTQKMSIDKWLNETNKGGGGKKPDIEGLIKTTGLNMFDPNVQRVVNGYANDIFAGVITPQNAIKNYNARAGEFNDSWGGGPLQNDALGNFLNALQRQYHPSKGGGKISAAEQARRARVLRS